jgi:hypothetical protein
MKVRGNFFVPPPIEMPAIIVFAAIGGKRDVPIVKKF